MVNLFSVGGVWGAERPVCAALLIGQGTLLIEHTPGDAAVIQTDVAVADTYAHDLITWFTDKVDTKVEELGDHFGGLELHGLDLLPEDSSNNVDYCCHSENNSPHVGIEFLIINLRKEGDQVVGGGEGFCEVHVKNGAVGGCVEVSQPRDQYGTPGAPAQPPATFLNISTAYQSHQQL